MRFITTLLVLISFSILGCDIQWSGSSSKPNRVLRLATTTSTRDSGLLDKLLPSFEAANQCHITVIAVGTGAALKLGERGEVDVLIVHAPEAEAVFMNDGHGQHHQPFMENYFMLLGPSSDPADIRDKSPAVALEAIAPDFTFISRGDDSGTHKKEINLWNQMGGVPQYPRYYETGQAMANTLMIAEEKQAYVLTDRATYLRFKSKLSLIPLVTEDPLLRNRYSVITVTPEKNDMINGYLAEQLAAYLITETALRAISDYRIDNEPLFTPLTQK